MSGPAMMVVALALAQNAGGGSAPTSQPRAAERTMPVEASSRPTSRRAGHPPPKEIDALLRSDVAERRLEGFAQWHRWQMTLSEEQRADAAAHLIDAVYLPALGDVAVYEMRSDERRLAAYKIMADLGGQQVYPYFLWGATDMDEHGPPGLVQDFFEAQGDPTLIGHMPQSYRWQKVIERINARWADKPAPAQNWEPIKPEQFIEQLGDPDPRKRRIAVRAVTVCKKIDRNSVCEALRRLLGDADPDTRTVTLESLTISGCPDLCSALKEVVEDQQEDLTRRKLALQAVVICGADSDWTAEWIVDNLRDWPAALDPFAKEALVKLRPKGDTPRTRYKQQIGQMLKRCRHERTRRVLTDALAEM